MAQIKQDIKDKIKELGHTMADLSAAIDVPYNSLNWYLNGRMGMPPEIYTKIQEQFKIWGVENGKTATE